MKFNPTQLILVLIVVSMMSFVACSSVPEDVASAGISDNSGQTNSLGDASWKEIDSSKSNLEFEGYGPGKSHLGTFDSWNAQLGFADGKLVAAKGTIDPATVNTGIGGLDSHLKSDDFFDVENYPAIVIETTQIDHESSMVIADLTFHGVTKSITFPVNLTDDGMSADFLLDVTPFNLKYVAINDEVRIKFDLVI